MLCIPARDDVRRLGREKCCLLDEYNYVHNKICLPARKHAVPELPVSLRADYKPMLMLRLQTYQLSASRSPESGSRLGARLNHQGELCYPQLQPGVATSAHWPAVADLNPETLIQCQQIVKVIVLDKGGRGRMEAFLSQTPTHQLIQSAVSTPVRSPEGGNQGTPSKNVSQPPLPPPPPPYNHPHQFCPPDLVLGRRRHSSGTRSLV